jgi:hypothetical protein
MLHDYEAADRTCRYCGYTFETFAEKESHEAETFRIASMFEKTPEEVDN